MLNIGIIGPGRIAVKHANALKTLSTARLYSITGRTLESAKAFAEKYQADAKVYDNLHHMLDDPNLHAVIIATPDNLHAEQIILSATAKKAILIEKPVCTSIESGNKILDSINKNSTFLAVGYHSRWHPELRFVALKARNNELGEISRIQLRWSVNFIDHAKWRLDPVLGKWCCLSALGTHLIDQARWMLLPTCGEVIKSTSHVEYLANTTIDKTASITLQFESGAIAEIFCSSLIDEPLSLKIHTNKMDVFGDNLAGLAEQRKLLINNEAFTFEATNPFLSQLETFISSLTNRTPPEVSIEEGLKNVKQLLSIKP